MISHSRTRGFGVVEIVIVTAMIVGALFAFSQVGVVAVRLLRAEQKNLEATLLAREALEAVRSARDESWAGNIAWRTAIQNPSLPYYPVVVNGKWSLATTSPGLINGAYTRSVIFEKVSRNAQDEIVSSGGTDDSGTRKVTAYATSTAAQAVLSTYITDFQSSLGRPTETNAVSFEDASTEGNLALFPSNNAGDGDPAQSFTTLATPIVVSKVELLLRRATTTPSNVYAELRASPTGAVLGASNVITGATIASTSPAWVEFRFSDPVSLGAATKYHIRLRSIPSSTDAGSGSAGYIYWDYKQTASSPYAGGEARRFIGRLSNPSDSGELLSQHDYGFRVYAMQ